MQIVIDIPEKWFDDMVKEEFCEVDELCAVIQHGIQLPKGHGDLIDRKCLYDFRKWLFTCQKDCDENDEIWFTSTEVINKIKQYSAVIEADTENGGIDMANYYEFTSYITDQVMNILLTMERDVCNSLCNCNDIKEGMFKAGTYMGEARSDIYKLLKAEQDKSYDAKKARYKAESEGE